MLLRSLVFCSVLLLTGCAQQSAHLPPDKMVPLMVDLHLADAYSGLIRDSLGMALGKNYDSLARWTKIIFAKHQVTREQFGSSMDWYRDHPLELDSLYAHIIPALDSSRKK